MADEVHPLKLLVDTHVHFHECFTWMAFLDAAFANFARARRHSGWDPEWVGCMMFTETAGVNHYRALLDDPALARALGWRVEKGDDGCSAMLRRPGNGAMTIVAGRQIVTAEHLEVLALGCVDELPDGRPIRDVVRAVADRDALAVIPWGFGKWLGRRGQIVRDLIERADGTGLWLGDNGGRMRVLPRPHLFNWSERHGVVVLGGSDPLPLSAHVTRPGSYGSVLDVSHEEARAGSAIKAAIRALHHTPPAFGGLSSLPAAIASQVGLRWRAGRSRRAQMVAVA